MQGYQAKSARHIAGSVEHRAEVQGAERSDARSANVEGLDGSPKARSLLQMRNAFDRSTRVQSQLALQRALDREAAGQAPRRPRAKPPLQMKGLPVVDAAGLGRAPHPLGNIASEAEFSAKIRQLAASTTSVSTEVLQRMDGGEEEKSGRTLRASTRIQSLPLADTVRETRGATRNRELIQSGAPVRPNLARTPFREDSSGTKLWDGSKRPAWNGRDQDFIDGQPSQESAEHKRIEYECVVARGGTKKYLPKLRDKKSGEEYVTVGHLAQWRDWCVSKCEPHDYEVEGGTIEAYSWDEINEAYADQTNLQLEGNVYNTTTSARSYRGDPHNQRWK